MNALIFEANRSYVAARASRLLRRFGADDRGMTAEQIVLTGAAVIGAAVVAGIIWAKMQDGANSIQTPSP